MVKPFFSKKTKKALFFNLFLGGAWFAFSLSPIFTPIAQAGTFSFIDSLFAKVTNVTNAQGTSLNSQTMPLLAAVVNLDPKPATGGGDITIVSGSALAAQESPGSDSDTFDRPSSSQISVYTVRNGDTLSGIADMFEVSVNTIVWANEIKGGVIHEGDVLVILPVTGVQHKVVKGETIESVAKKYQSTVRDVASYNNIAEDAALAVGQSIIIPNGKIAPKPAAPTNSTKIKNIASGKTKQSYLGGAGPALSGYYSWPLEGGILTQDIHGWNGVDFGAPKGTPIYAAAEGTVVIAKANGGWNGGYGNYVVVQHSNGTQTLYAHASSVLVTVGETVSKGQMIARVGMTGLSTGMHLHFEVRGAANPFGH